MILDDVCEVKNDPDRMARELILDLRYNMTLKAEAVIRGVVLAKGRHGNVVALGNFCRVIGTINGNINFERIIDANQCDTHSATDH